MRQDRPGRHAECQGKSAQPGDRALVDPTELVRAIDRADQVATQVTTGVARTHPSIAIAKIIK